MTRNALALFAVATMLTGCHDKEVHSPRPSLSSRRRQIWPLLLRWVRLGAKDREQADVYVWIHRALGKTNTGGRAVRRLRRGQRLVRGRGHRRGACDAESKALYARGRIVVWWRERASRRRRRSPISPTSASSRSPSPIPAHAPYGKAASKRWRRRASGRRCTEAGWSRRERAADAAVRAIGQRRSRRRRAVARLVTKGGEYVLVDDALHAPIDQALVVCGKDAERQKRARAFTAFVSSPEGRANHEKSTAFFLPGETHIAEAR